MHSLRYSILCVLFLKCCPIQGDPDDLKTPMKNSNAAPLDAALFGPHDAQYHEKMKDLKRHLRANIAAEERELNGAHRVAVDNLLTQSECEALIELAGVSIIYAFHNDSLLLATKF